MRRLALLPLLVGGFALAQGPPAPVPSPEFAIVAAKRPGLPARAAALMLTAQQGGPIQVAALAVPLAQAATGTRWGLVVDVEGSSLLGDRRDGTLAVDIAAYPVSGSGTIGAGVFAGFVLDLAVAAETLEEGGIKYITTLTTAPGAVRLRVLVRTGQANTFGLVETPLAAAGAATQPPLVVAEPPGAWLLARDETSAPYPFVLGGEPLIPAARPVLVPRRETIGWLTTAPAGETPLRGSLAKADGTRVATLELRRERGATADGEAAFRFTLPPVPPGAYTLSVIADDAHAASASPLPVVVVDEKAAKVPVIWASFTASPGDGGSLQARFSTTKVKLLPLDTLKAAYLDALRRVADGPSALQEAVIAMEGGALEGKTLKEAARLAEAESAVSRELARSERDVVLDLLRLHLDLRHTYSARREAIAEAYTVRRVEELLTMLALQSSGRDARKRGADAVACVGGEMQRERAAAIVERLYRKALSYDAGNAAALEGWAAELESAGQYRAAVSLLTRLVDADPANAEARLRLAINRLRTRATMASAADALAPSLTAENPPWVRAVAYQQLIGERIAAEKWDEARTLVKQALDAVPGEPGLVAQQVYVLDRLRRGVEARSIARGPAMRAREEDTARYRYTLQPHTELDAACTMLGQRPAPEALAKALGVRIGGGQ